MSISGFRSHKYKRDAKCSKFTSDRFKSNYKQKTTNPTLFGTPNQIGQQKCPYLRTMFRKALAVVLVAIVIGQLGAMWAVLVSAIWVHKQAKEIRISNPQLWEHLSLSESEFLQFSREDDELEIDGKLYDIVELNQMDECFEVIAVADHVEQNMKRNLGGLEQTENQLNDWAKIACAFSLAVCQPEEMEEISHFLSDMEVSPCTHPNDFLRKGIFNRPEQPPNV
jgi:hypothetical protein